MVLAHRRYTMFLWGYIFLALLSFVLTLHLEVLREEGFYVSTSIEMVHFHDYLHRFYLGTMSLRPPLYNWLIIVLSNMLGWKHIVLAMRIIAAGSTMLTALLLGWFTQRVFKQMLFSLLVASFYLTGDVLLIRGWLAYADPLLTLGIFLSLSFLWLAVNEKNRTFLAIAAFGVLMGCFAKTLTGIVFYATTFLVLLCRSRSRRFLYTPYSLFVHVVLFACIAGWLYCVAPSHGVPNIQELFSHEGSQGLFSHGRAFLGFIGDLIGKNIPLLLFVLYFLIRRKGERDESMHDTIITFLWIFLLSVAPYMTAGIFVMRYFLPLVPIMALLAAYVFWCQGNRAVKPVIFCLAFSLIFKYVYIIAAPVIDQHLYHTQMNMHLRAAEKVYNATRPYPIYSAQYIPIMKANLDLLGLPDHHIVRDIKLQSETGDKDYFLLSTVPYLNGQAHEVAHIRLSRSLEQANYGSHYYLYCFGAACK